jgi:hypothetical protein
MAIRVAAGTADLICDYADGFVVEVTGASDVDAATRALARARADIEALSTVSPADPEGPMVSQPVLGPEGPLIRVARLEVSDDLLCSVPDLVADRLEAAGVVDAVVRAPEPGGKLDRLDSCPNAVVLRLFPPPMGNGGSLPASWIDFAGEWVLGDMAPGDGVPLRLLAVEFDVKVADAPAVLHQASTAQAWCDIVNGHIDERIRTASITFGKARHVALAAGGPACDSQALLARFDLLCEVAREYAGDAAYACLDFEHTFDGIGLGLPNTGWRDRGGASPNLVAGRLSDVLVPDAYPYQILGRGHLARLGYDDYDEADPPIGEVIAPGKVELFIGEPVDWLPIYDAREPVLEQGWEQLRPLLADDREVAELLGHRPELVPEPGPGATAGHERDLPTDGAVMPAMADITLETLPHGRRGLRLTFLELAAWLAHEPHSDAPESVSPVLATYARWFASALDDRRRQTLKDRARRLIGTAQHGPDRFTSGAPALSSEDSARAWLATDWLIRVQAASWLRRAGLTEAGTRLESIGPTSNHLDLVRSVDVLGSAIMIAGRRIDLTSSIAGAERADDSALVEHAAWEAWERASEAGGWVAASEAASVGVPAELAYATDLRVIECARHAHVRDELEAARRSIGDTAWATALHSVADEAWTAGWHAAHSAVDAQAVLPLRTATDRAVRAALSRAGADDDAREASLDAAESAAKERLTRAALGTESWASHTHPWDAAFEAAGTIPEGSLWAQVQEMTRAAVEEGPWNAGMEAARRAVDEVLRDAPDLVARSVGAAVAREAAGIAARGVALRAAAVARAQGAGAAEATMAADAALAPTVAELQDAAFALLDVLISVGDDEAAQSG